MAPVESEHPLVEVGREMLGADRALHGSQQPAQQITSDAASLCPLDKLHFISAVQGTQQTIWCNV